MCRAIHYINKANNGARREASIVPARQQPLFYFVCCVSSGYFGFEEPHLLMYNAWNSLCFPRPCVGQHGLSEARTQWC